MAMPPRRGPLMPHPEYSRVNYPHQGERMRRAMFWCAIAIMLAFFAGMLGITYSVFSAVPVNYSNH